MSYDPAGRLIKYDVPASTRFAYAGGQIIQEVNSTGVVLRRYVPGPGVDEPLVWYEGAGTAGRRWLHADERGSVIAISDGSGAMLGINRYDEYGIPRTGNIGRFQYTGQAWLSELGMYHYKARTYSPTLGRFMQTDPIGYGDGLNWYNYVGGDPVNARDPSGLVATSGQDQCSSQLWGQYWVYPDGHMKLARETVELRTTCIPSFNLEGALGNISFDLSLLNPEIVVTAPKKFNCPPSGDRLTISPFGVGVTGFLLLGGASLSTDAGLSIPTSAVHGNFRGTQLYANTSVTAMAGLGVFFGAGDNKGVGLTHTPLPTGLSTSQTIGVSGGAAWAAGAEAQVTGDKNSISAAGSGGPRVGYGAYAAGAVKFSATVASPELCY